MTEAMNFQSMIRQATLRVGLDQLAREGRKSIALLSKEKLEDLIRGAVRTIVEKHRVPAGTFDAETRAELVEMVHQYELTDQAKSAVEESRQSLAEELAGLRRELDRQKAAARIENTLIAGSEAFALELDRQAAYVFDRRRLLLDHAGSPEEKAELQGVEETMRAIVERIVAAERGRFEIWGGRTREFGLLHRRIEKLQEHIATLETAFRTLADTKAFSNQNVRNVLRQLGLVEDDPNFAKKRDMLKFVLDANREQKIRAADLERRGITLASPGRPTPSM